MNEIFDPTQISYDAVYPAVMAYDLRIEASAFRLYGIIRGLTRLEGYCFATNTYLAKFLDCCENSITNYLRSLKECGYIEIETRKSGLKWDRRIYISDQFKKCLRSPRRCDSESEVVEDSPRDAPDEIKKMFTKPNGLGLEPQPVGTYNRKNINKKKNIYPEKGGEPPASPPPDIKQVFFSYTGKFTGNTHIELTEEDYNKLVSWHSKEALDAQWERIDLWATKNAKRWKKVEDLKVFIHDWMINPINAARETKAAVSSVAQSKFPPSQAESERRARCSAEKLRELHPELFASKPNPLGKNFPDCKDAYVSTDPATGRDYLKVCVERRGQAPLVDTILFFSDGSFELKLRKVLEKLGIDPAGIV